MKSKLLCTVSLLLPAFLFGAKIHKITPITTDKEIRMEVTLSANSNDRLRLTASISHTQDNKMLCTDSKEFIFKHRTDTTVIWNISALVPKLWSPAAPHLYDLNIETGSQTLHQRIGFRRFDQRNGQFYLNNKPIYLRGNAINPPHRGIPEELEKSKDFARDYVRYMKSLNINIIRIPENKNWLDVCDEEGMMVFAGRYGRPKHATPSAPPIDFDLSLQTYKDIDLGPFTPHPSVVIYVVTNEMPYEGNTGDLYRDFLTRMCNALKQWDDTRLYIGNAGYGLGHSGDIYDVHRYWGWYYNSFLTYLNMRHTNMWQNPGKEQPITFTECVGNYTGIDGRFNLCSRTKQPGSQKCWTGHLPETEQPEAALAYQAFVLKNATELFRRLRSQNNYLAGTMPFTIMFHHWDGISSFAEMKPKPVAKQYQISYQPILLSWENWQSQIYAGNTLSVVAHVVNDDDWGNDLINANLRWWIEKEGVKVTEGEVAIPSVRYYDSYSKSLSIPIPAQIETGEYQLKGQIWANGQQVSYNESELFIAGNKWKATQVSPQRIYVYDSSDQQETVRALQHLGYQVSWIQSLNALPKKSTLVVGKDSWDTYLNSQTSVLQKHVHKGGRIICLEQSSTTSHTSWLPASVPFLKESNNDPTYLSPTIAYKDGMNINLERPTHPVFCGLTPKQFRLWSDYSAYDESQEGFPAIYPVNYGYDLSQSDLKDIAILANYSRALTGTALAEFFIGKGSVLLSGFDLINRSLVDPVADKLLYNMVNYMAQEKQHLPYVEVSDSINWGDYASEQGIVNAPCNGLMVNTVPIVPQGKEHEAAYELKIDEYGYQYAGSYGGWNSKPGVQYVPRGRRPMAPFTFSKGGSPIISKASDIGEGYFYMTLLKPKKMMVTVVENPSNEPILISLSVNDGTWTTHCIAPKQQEHIQTSIAKLKRTVKVELKGDRRTVLLKTILHD